MQDQIIELTAEEANAFGTTFNGMKALTTVKLGSKAAVKAITQDDRIMKLYGTLTYKNSAAHATGNEPYYITADGLGDYMNATIRLAKFLTDNNVTVSQANINPSKIGVGADMYIGSDLSNYSLVNSNQTWINDYKKFLKQIKIQSTCMHITEPYLGTSSASKNAKFNVRIVKVKKNALKSSTTTKANGTKVTKWSRTGYIVFGILSPQICKQTTCNLLKIKFEASGQEKEDPEPNDPLKLFLYKTEHSN